MVPLFGKGFYHPVGPAEALSRWCQNQGEVFLSNTGTSTREVEIDFLAERPFGLANLQIQCGPVLQNVILGSEARRGRFKLSVPPGKTRMTLTCQGPDHVETHADPRQLQSFTLSYRLIYFQVHDAHEHDYLELYAQ